MRRMWSQADVGSGLVCDHISIDILIYVYIYIYTPSGILIIIYIEHGSFIVDLADLAVKDGDV